MIDPTVAFTNTAGASGNLASNGWNTFIAGYSGEFTFKTASAYSYTYGPVNCAASCKGNYGEYYYPSLPGAFIYEEYLTGVFDIPYSGSEEASGIFGPAANTFASGTYRQTGQTAAVGPYAFRYDGGAENNYQVDYCAGTGAAGTSAGSCPISGTGGVIANNTAVAAALVLTGAVGSSQPIVAADGATLYESDSIVPSDSVTSYGSYTPGTWVNSFSSTVTVSGTSENSSGQPGLGYGSTAMGTNTTSAFTSPLATQTAPCSSVPCSGTATASFNYNSSQFPEGIDPVCIQGKSYAGTLGNNACWNVQIDRTPPVAPTVGSLPNGGAVEDSNAGSITVQQSDPPAPGANASSGPASLSVSVDGGTPISQPCAATCSYTPPAGLSEGRHTLAFSTTDGAGNVGPSTTVNFIVDQTDPDVTVSGPAFMDQQSAPTTGKLALTVSASDPNSGEVTSGVVQIQTFVDNVLDPSGPTASQTCQGGGCSLSASGSIDFSQLSVGEHTIVVTATDAADNIGSQTWRVEVGGTPTQATPGCTPGQATSLLPSLSLPPQTAAQVATSLQGAAATLLNDPAHGTLGDESIIPGLTPVTGGYDETGTDVGAFISASGQGSFGVGGASDGLCVNPVVSTTSTTQGSLEGDAAAVFANTGIQSNTILRPTAYGIEDFQQMLGPSASLAAWQVSLTSTERLVSLDPQTVAVVDTTGVTDYVSPTEATAPQGGTVAAGSTLDSEIASASSQLSSETASLGQALGQVTSGQLIAVLTVPSAVDSLNDSLPTSLSITGTNTVTLTVGGTLVYPAYSALAVLDAGEETTNNSASSEIQGPSDQGPSAPASESTDSDGYTVDETNVLGDLSSPSSSTTSVSPASLPSQVSPTSKPAPLTCRLTSIVGTVRSAYAYTKSVKVGHELDCSQDAGTTGTVYDRLVNLNGKTVASEADCYSDTSSCSTYRTATITADNITYTMNLKARVILNNPDYKWVPRTEQQIEDCDGFGGHTLTCHFSFEFQVFDHRCDLTYAGIPSNFPASGDTSQIYQPVPTAPTFTDEDGNVIPFYIGYYVTLAGGNLVGGFGYFHTQVKHGYDYNPTPIYTGGSSSPDTDATRLALSDPLSVVEDPYKSDTFTYEEDHEYTGVNGVTCRRYVAVQRAAPAQARPAGVVTSFGGVPTEFNTTAG